MDILYTTTDKIRNVLGCDDQDLPDAIIEQQDLDLAMEERLATVYPTHETASGVDIERRLALWCLYFGALQLIETSRLAIAQKIQANTDQIQRFDTDFDALAATLARKVSKLESAMNPTLAGTTPTLFSRAVPGYDPITGA